MTEHELREKLEAIEWEGYPAIENAPVIDEIIKLITQYGDTREREGKLKLAEGWLNWVKSGGGHINRGNLEEVVAELKEEVK